MPYYHTNPLNDKIVVHTSSLCDLSVAIITDSEDRLLPEVLTALRDKYKNRVDWCRTCCIVKNATITCATRYDGELIDMMTVHYEGSETLDLLDYKTAMDEIRGGRLRLYTRGRDSGGDVYIEGVGDDEYLTTWPNSTTRDNLSEVEDCSLGKVGLSTP